MMGSVSAIKPDAGKPSTAMANLVCAPQKPIHAFQHISNKAAIACVHCMQAWYVHYALYATVLCNRVLGMQACQATDRIVIIPGALALSV